MLLTSNIICRVAFGKRPSDDNQEGARFGELMLECQWSFVNFFYRDYFPLMGWVDKLNGSMARLEKIFKRMDEFYQEVIDDHLKQNQPNKNPDSLKKVQQEVRNVVMNKGKVQEDDLYKLVYLKAVIKEALRLYPVVPLLVPHESINRCVIEGYEIPKKTLVYVNTWAIGRDPECWERPEEFEPERFISSGIDYKGADFELIPFGSGRRGCPGMSLGVATVELALSNLVYSFDWELPEETKDIDTSKAEGIVMHKRDALLLWLKFPIPNG